MNNDSIIDINKNLLLAGLAVHSSAETGHAVSYEIGVVFRERIDKPWEYPYRQRPVRCTASNETLVLVDAGKICIAEYGDYISWNPTFLTAFPMYFGTYNWEIAKDLIREGKRFKMSSTTHYTPR